MEVNYNREMMNNDISMGEYALLYYEDISQESIIRRIVISTILKLYKKKYVDIVINENDALIIKIKNGTEKLKSSEEYLYNCLKKIDSDSNSNITMAELSSKNNNVFSKGKNYLKKLILNEAMVDELIDTKKYKDKRKSFFRTFEILFVVIFGLLKPFFNYEFALLFGFILGLLFYNYRNNRENYFWKNYLKEKNRLIEDEMMKYGTKEEYRGIITEFSILFILYYFHIYLLAKLFYYSGIIYTIELIIALIISIIEFKKFKNINVFSDSAILNREKLYGLNNFLKDYSLINERKTEEIHLWEDYLSFSVLLGINTNITKELKFNLLVNNKETAIHFDYYENKYYYIDSNGSKVYINSENK